MLDDFGWCRLVDLAAQGEHPRMLGSSACGEATPVLQFPPHNETIRPLTFLTSNLWFDL